MPKSFSNAALSANELALWHPALLVGMQVPTAENRGSQQTQNNDLSTEATQRHSFTSRVENISFCSQSQSCDRIKWWLDIETFQHSSLFSLRQHCSALRCKVTPLFFFHSQARNLCNHLYTQTQLQRGKQQKLLHFFMNIKHFTGNTLHQAEKEIEPVWPT